LKYSQWDSKIQAKNWRYTGWVPGNKKPGIRAMATRVAAISRLIIN
jgi:hypothetical protein